MARIFRCTLEVRGYELDSFGHVNHGVYVRYLEHARWKLLEEEKIGLATFEEWKAWPVVANVDIRYAKPAYMGDPLEIASTHHEHTRVSITFKQTVRRIGAGAPPRPLSAADVAAGGELIAEARVKLVMVDERGRPTRLPDVISRAWEEPSP